MAAFALALAPICAWSAPPAVELFAELPVFAGLDVAPDGRHVAMLHAFNGHYHLTALNVETGADEFLLAGNRRRFRWCRFANEERILCAIEVVTDEAGALRSGMRLMALNVDGANKLDLLPAALSEGTAAPSRFENHVVSWLPGDPEHVLLAVRVDATSVQVVRVNLYTAVQEAVSGPLPPLDSWFADADGEVRLGAGFVDNDFRVVARPRGADVFTPLALPGRQGFTPPRVLGISADAATVDVAMRGAGGQIGVYRLALAQGTILRPLFEDPRFDFDGKLAYGADGTLLAAFETRDLPTVHFFDPAWQARLDTIGRKIDREAVVPVSWDREGKRMVLLGTGSSIPPSHYLYDVEDSDLVHLGTSYGRISEQGEVRVTQYQARDGLVVPAYLTLPRGRSARHLPTVVMPHDGPASRDDARFDYLVQFLASRGYAVLQPNFRGSTGYGRQFLDAGYRQWGLKMQDDVVDGIDWLVGEGIADPERICILGRGYGGYVAVMATIKTPQKVRCAATLGGIFDLRSMLANLHRYGFDRINRALILSEMSGWPLLDANSPVREAAHIDVPLLLVHGDADAVVPVEQSRGLVDALDAAGKGYRYVEQAGGDHALRGEAQRLQFLQELEAFLALYL